MAGVSLDLDFTLVIQGVIVVVLMFLLKKLIFGPYLETVDERERQTESTRNEADSLRTQAEETSQKYEASLESARARAAALRQGLRLEGVEAKEESIVSARRDANEVMASAQAEIGTQVEAARTALSAEVETLSKLVVEKVIGRGA
jgi:F-type H+-transporting ATPase subunit b